MSCLYIPYMWAFYTRHKTLLNKISFLIIDVYPVLFFSLIYGMDFMQFFLGFSYMYCLYEIGYIYNDVISIDKEQNPTYRIAKERFLFIKQHIGELIITRLIIAISIGWVLNEFYFIDSVFVFTIGLILLIIYYLHNYFRGRINIATMFGVVLLKYYIPLSIILYNNIELKKCIVIIALSIVLPRLIEYTEKKKLITWLYIKNIHRFRLLYILGLFTLILINGYFGIEYIVYMGLLLGYRCLCYIYAIRG